MKEPALAFDRVVRRFGRKVAGDGVTLSVAPDEILCLVGSNGAGKTTLLRLTHGYLFPDAGTFRTLGLDPVTQGLAVRVLRQQHGSELGPVEHPHAQALADDKRKMPTAASLRIRS